MHFPFLQLPVLGLGLELLLLIMLTLLTWPMVLTQYMERRWRVILV